MLNDSWHTFVTGDEIGHETADSGVQREPRALPDRQDSSCLSGRPWLYRKEASTSLARMGSESCSRRPSQEEQAGSLRYFPGSFGRQASSLESADPQRKR